MRPLATAPTCRCFNYTVYNVYAERVFDEHVSFCLLECLSVILRQLPRVQSHRLYVYYQLSQHTHADCQLDQFINCSMRCYKWLISTETKTADKRNAQLKEKGSSGKKRESRTVHKNTTLCNTIQRTNITSARIILVYHKVTSIFHGKNVLYEWHSCTGDGDWKAKPHVWISSHIGEHVLAHDFRRVSH